MVNAQNNAIGELQQQMLRVLAVVPKLVRHSLQLLLSFRSFQQ